MTYFQILNFDLKLEQNVFLNVVKKKKKELIFAFYRIVYFSKQIFESRTKGSQEIEILPLL